jgi:hypothetical protein
MSIGKIPENIPENADNYSQCSNYDDDDRDEVEMQNVGKKYVEINLAQELSQLGMVARDGEQEIEDLKN